LLLKKNLREGIVTQVLLVTRGEPATELFVG
jgi:hypothetical protein